MQAVVFSLLLGIAEQTQALAAAVDANTEEKRLLSRLLIKTKKAQTNAADLQRYISQNLFTCTSCNLLLFIIWLNWAMVKRSIQICSLSGPYFAFQTAN